MSLLGTDLGTSGVKAVAFSLNGDIVGECSARYRLSYPGENRVEVDVDTLWDALASAIRGASQQANHDPVKAMAISCQGETFLLTDRQNRPLYPAIANADNRAQAEVLALQELIPPEEIYEITGAPPHSMFPLAKIAWLAKHEPEVLARAERCLSLADYIIARLQFAPVIDPSLASRTQLFDIRQRDWSDRLCGAISLDRGCLPVVRASGTSVGHLSPQTARLLGVPDRTLLALGGHDQPCASLGLGVIKPGLVGDSAGSYECLTISSGAPSQGKRAKSACLNSYCHVVPGQYITLAFFPSGLMLNWFATELCGIPQDEIAATFMELEREAAEPSGLLVLPHLVGACNPRWNPQAAGAIAGLTLGTSRAAIYRGILEGLASEFAANVDVLDTLAGGIEEIRICGGGSRSCLGLKLRASACNKTLRSLRTTEASCLGAAMLAGVASGEFSDVLEASCQMVKFEGAVLPDPGLRDWVSLHRTAYEGLYEYLALRVPHKMVDRNRIDRFVDRDQKPESNVLESPEPT